MTDEAIQLTCGNEGNWYYINVTIAKVIWESRGEYQCIADGQLRSITLLVKGETFEIAGRGKPIILWTSYLGSCVLSPVSVQPKFAFDLKVG